MDKVDNNNNVFFQVSWRRSVNWVCHSQEVCPVCGLLWQSLDGAFKNVSLLSRKIRTILAWEDSWMKAYDFGLLWGHWVLSPRKWSFLQCYKLHCFQLISFDTFLTSFWQLSWLSFSTGQSKCYTRGRRKPSWHLSLSLKALAFFDGHFQNKPKESCQNGVNSRRASL